LHVVLERTRIEHLLQLVEPGQLEREGVVSGLVGDRRISPAVDGFVDRGHGRALQCSS
jgi:hypothetical protein